MKKLLLILLVLITGLFVNGQVTPVTGGYPITQGLGSANAIVRTPGGALGGNLVVWRYTDTTAANLTQIKNYPFAIIATTSTNSLWTRNQYATQWMSGSGTVDIDFFEFLNDSTIVICFSNGSCDTIDFNNNNVFVTVNNLFGGCNNLLSGGIVTANDPANTLVFDVTAADYTIGCKAYHTDADQVTLADGDATFDRFDVVIVDTNEVVSVLQGTPSADPQVPQINHASQLVLTTFLVPAGATTATDLGITIDIIYDEDLQVAGGEWDSSGVAWTRDFANTSFPAHLAKDLLLSGSTTSTSQIKWTTTDTMRKGQFDILKLYIRLTDAWVNGQALDIAFYHGTTKVTNSVILSNNSFGFDQTVTASYQIIAIPMAQFNFSDSIFFSIVIKPNGDPFASQAFRLDWVQLQGGINQALGGSSGLYWWNQYSVPQPANGWVTGDLRLEGQFQSPQRISGNTFYSGSLKAGRQAIANGVEATVFGEYARATASGAISIGSQAGLTGNNGKGITISQYGTTSSVTDVNIGGLAVTGTGDVAVGINAAIVGDNNVGIGETAQITGSNNVVIGYNSVSSFSNTLVLGRSVTATANNQFIIPSTITNVRWGAFGDGTITGTPTYLAAWDVNGNFVEFPPGGIGGGLLIDADNGLSVRSAETAVLGQNEAEVGNPAILLSNREVPMGGFYLTLNASATQAGNIFQTKNAAAAVRARITNDAEFSNTGGQTGSEIFGDGATVSGTNSTIIGNSASGGSENVVIGTSATVATSTGNVVIGRASSLSSVGIGNVLIGAASSLGGSSGSNVLIGNSLASTGAGGVGVGYSIIIAGQNNVAIGNSANVQHNYSQAYGTLATTTANNQLVFGASDPSAEGVNDAYIGRGVTATTANNLKLQTTGASGTNMAGNQFTLAGSPATGNAIAGNLIFQTSVLGSTGTTLQTLGDRYNIVGKYTTLTESSATSFARVNVPSNTVAGGEVIVSVEANDGTEFQVRTLTFAWTAANKAGTTDADISTPVESISISSGTLTVTITIVDAGSGNVDFKADATSSLTQTVLRANCHVFKNFGTGSIVSQ